MWILHLTDLMEKMNENKIIVFKLVSKCLCYYCVSCMCGCVCVCVMYERLYKRAFELFFNLFQAFFSFFFMNVRTFYMIYMIQSLVL